MSPSLPNERDSRVDRGERRSVKHSAPDSDDSEHEQVEFTEDFPTSNKTLKTIKPAMKRPQRLKHKKTFATKEHMISLIDQVCSAQDAVIQQKREREGVTLKIQTQRKETYKAKKNKKEAKLEKIKDKLRNKKGGRHAKHKDGDSTNKEEEKDIQPKKDYRGHKKKKRVSFKE